MNNFRLVIADDDPAIRQILRDLAENLGAQVLAEADNGRVAIEHVQRLQPNVLFLDVSMPVMGGFPAARFLREHQPELSIIIISQYQQKACAEEALQLGAKAYVTKGSLVTDLGPAIETVLAGGTFVSPRARNGTAGTRTP
ncbi:MAG TPA: response regulator transcription factor [Bryobacteraceae bacterium]|jgi:NarL family two-component system response regulator YdfI|nr:response regulator transcription factor [Bryobacteraceae bacterium]